jgi:uncharacterized protein (TIGR02217 family)
MPVDSTTRFPTDISYGSRGGPEFSTEIVELGSGHEQRNINWTYPRERWDVAYGVKTKAQLQTLIEFFYAMQGRAYTFRFKNPDDFELTDQEIGTGDGSTTAFQIVKTYTYGGMTLTRKITQCHASLGIWSFYVDGVGAGGVLDAATGIWTATTPPSSGAVVTCTGEFDIPARFDTDFLPVQFSDYEARAVSVPVLEVRM